MNVKIKLVHPLAKMPHRAHPTDSGADLYAVESMTLEPGARGLVRIGLALELPPGFEAQMRPRSSLSRTGFNVALGTIDQAYRGELVAIAHNANTLLPWIIVPGDRIAQLVIQPVIYPGFVVVDRDLVETDRGCGGFGSTGR